MNTDKNTFQLIAGLAIATGLLLLIPFTAMQFTDEVAWTLSDFVVAGSLLFGTGFAYILVTRFIAPQMSDSTVYRVAVGFALFTGLFLIWSNLAVGIIGSDDNPINVYYFFVPFIGIIGAIIARFRSQGMAYTMFAMALGQAIIVMIALYTGVHHSPDIAVYKIFAVNGFFIMLFTVSGLLFRYDKQERASSNADSEVNMT